MRNGLCLLVLCLALYLCLSMLSLSLSVWLYVVLYVFLPQCRHSVLETLSCPRASSDSEWAERSNEAEKKKKKKKRR